MVSVAQQQQPESPEELRRKIEQLQLEIAQAGQSKGAGRAEEEEEEYSEYEEVVEEEITENDEEEYEIIEEEVIASPTNSPPGRGRRVQPSNKPASPTKAQDSPPVRHHPRPANAAPEQHHDGYRKQMDSLKQKYSFDKPGWAAPAEVINKEEVIDVDSIDNPLLKPAQMEGYKRQVYEKDIDLVKGKHVKEITKVEPRLAWIVVNVNKRKVGKVVMHLYGRDVSGLVDQFLELKGNSIERQGNGGFAVVGQEPTLYVTAGGSGRGLEGKSGVHGVIQEGRDIFQTVMGAEDGAVLSVKQAHIYPVKKGKKGI